MSFMPIEEIHGDHLLKPQKAVAVSLEQIDLSQLLNQVHEPIYHIVIKPWLGKTVIEVKTQHQLLMFDATDLKPITPITESMVIKVLTSNLIPGLQVDSIKRLTETPSEARGRQAPLWQVQLEGAENARIYISELNGEIVAKRTDQWRLFDFMWMLHIMDYENRSDFNHPLLYLTALSAFVFTFTGFMLLFFSFKRKRPNKPQ